MKNRFHTSGGFTLIELSIVLVIIGLIVGAIIAGQDLIAAAALRAQITQIEKYETAVNTFRVKYGYLPGDIPEPTATGCGFVTRGTFAGEGDGNGFMEGVNANGAGRNFSTAEGIGENVMFWVDLSTASLIEGSFRTASPTAAPGGAITLNSTPAIRDYLPQGKIGRNNYIYVYSNIGYNYFGISAAIGMQTNSAYTSNTGITPLEALSLDTKIDDGYPQYGTVLSWYVQNINVTWVGASDTSATVGNTTTCYDNNNTVATVQHYSTEIGGSNITCALSFRFR